LRLGLGNDGLNLGLGCQRLRRDRGRLWDRDGRRRRHWRFGRWRCRYGRLLTLGEGFLAALQRRLVLGVLCGFLPGSLDRPGLLFGDRRLAAAVHDHAGHAEDTAGDHVLGVAGGELAGARHVLARDRGRDYPSAVPVAGIVTKLLNRYLETSP
jgi:hypothetical protein